MTNTIPNVPRELLADLLGNDHDKRIMAERHLLAMLANAPSPAGVDGLEVETYLHTMHMELGRTEQFCSKWKGDPFGVSGVDYSSTYSVTSEPLCRLSDAQAIIDGLRGEIDKLMTTFVRVADHLHIDCEKAKSAPGKPSDVFIAAIDQQAKRIGELAELAAQASVNCKNTAYYLRKYRPDLADICSGWCVAIDAALSAGKEGSDGK